MRWWAVTAAGVAIGGALAWTLASGSRAVHTSAVPPAPPGTLIVTTVSEDGTPFTVAAYGLSRPHARGFELAPEPVNGSATETLPNQERITLPAQGPISRVWVATEDGRLGCSGPIDPQGLRRLRITLPPLQPIDVTVVDDVDGAARPRARVVAVPMQGSGVPLGAVLLDRHSGRKALFELTDAQGCLRLTGFSGTGAYVCATSNGRAPRSKFVRARPGDRVTLRLPQPPKQPAHLMGKLRWPDGSPAAVAQVRVERVDGTNAGFPAEHTDGKGSFAIGVPLEPGRYRVLGYQRKRFGWRLQGVAETDVERGAATVVDLRLEPSNLQALLYLRLTQNGLPVSQCRLSIFRMEHGSQAGGVSAQTGNHGEAFVYIRRAERYLLQADPSGRDGRPHYVLFDAPPDRQALDVSLDDHATLTLTRPTRDALGEPLGTMRLICAPDPARPLAGFELEAFPADEGASRVVISNVPPGRYQIWMKPAKGRSFDDWHRWSGIDVTAGERSVTLPAPPKRGRITGRVLDRQGRPVAGAEVWLSFGTAHMSRRNLGVIGPDGLFECPDVPPGPVRVTGGVELPDGTGHAAAPTDIDLAPGETRWLDLRLR